MAIVGSTTTGRIRQRRVSTHSAAARRLKFLALIVPLLAALAGRTEAARKPDAFIHKNLLCAEYAGDCSSCLDAGCFYQGEGSCLSGCLIQDVSCLGGSSAKCPKSKDTCKRAKNCDECAEAGCVFQDGKCKPECEFGFLGRFLAACYSTGEECASAVVEETSLKIVNEKVDFFECQSHNDDCGSCLDAGCAYHGEGSCVEECGLIADVSCWEGDSAQCPKPASVCSKATTCEDCADAGCTFQEGQCKPECEYGPLGDFLAECFSSSGDCR